MVLSDPGNVMSNYALKQIDDAIALFASLIEHGGGTPRYRANLEWLKKLRARALASLQAAALGPSPDDHQHINGSQRGVGEDEELVGWRTRLIERAGQSQYKSQTIRLGESPGDNRMLGEVNGRRSHLQDTVAWNQRSAVSLEDSVSPAQAHTMSTNDLVRRSRKATKQANVPSSPAFGSPCCYRDFLIHLIINKR